MPTQRQLRVNNLIRDEVAAILQRDLEDPHLRLGMVTVTGVRVSADLRNAKVFVSVLGDAEAKREAIKALARARSYVRGLLRDRLDLRRIPEVLFELDETAERADHLNRLLKRISAEEPQDDVPDEQPTP